MAFVDHLGNLLERGTVQVLSRLWAVGLSPNTNEVLLERHRSEGRIKVEQSSATVYAQEVSDINVVGQRGTESNNSDDRLA